MMMNDQMKATVLYDYKNMIVESKLHTGLTLDIDH